MNTVPKYLIGTGIGAIALLGIFLALARMPGEERTGGPSVVTTVGTVPVADQPPSSVAAAETSQSPVPFVAESIPALPPNATSVPDRDLLILSSAVDLSKASVHRPNKEQWKQAILAAERLMQGPCDCEQRNWLTQFVDMGNFALSDSEPEYREKARLMATLGRNDEQAMALSQRNR